MPESIFDGCTETCGYLAAVGAIIAWGSFGVPLKYAKMQPKTGGAPPPEVNFFVMQSYKTLVCFMTCWLVVFLGEEIRFSYWGIVSGLFWVPGASCGIYGIRNAGLATAVGTWSSIQVLTSFVFGIIVFKEEVRSFNSACLAFLWLVAGLVGMSRYAGLAAAQAQESKQLPSIPAASSIESEADMNAPLLESTTSSIPPSPPIVRKLVRGNSLVMESEIEMLPTVKSDIKSSTSDSDITSPFDDEDYVMMLGSSASPKRQPQYSFKYDKHPQNKDYVVLFGGRFALHRRQMGMLGAVVNGAWGGCALFPLHYAKRDHGLSGASFLISYASGAFIVNTIMWLLLYLYYYYFQAKQNWMDAAQCLPKWHLQELWKPGILAGLLYSFGNFCSILAVTFLGQASGYSFCQLQLIVSGCWSVFYFREITEQTIVAKWFVSAAVAIIGIIWLSWEHKGPAAH